jgi:hypothetical protein
MMCSVRWGVLELLPVRLFVMDVCVYVVCLVTGVLGTRMNTAITTLDKNEDTFVVLSKLLKSVRLFTLDSGTRQQTTFMHSLLHDAIANSNELFACKLLSMMKMLRTEEDSRRRQSGDVFAGRGGVHDTVADSDEEMVYHGKRVLQPCSHA